MSESEQAAIQASENEINRLANNEQAPAKQKTPAYEEIETPDAPVRARNFVVQVVRNRNGEERFRVMKDLPENNSLVPAPEFGRKVYKTSDAAKAAIKKYVKIANAKYAEAHPAETSETTPTETPAETPKAETPATETPEAETPKLDPKVKNRLEMNLQFFADLLNEKNNLQKKLAETGKLDVKEKRRINDQINAIDERLTGIRKTISNTAVSAGLVTPEQIANDPEMKSIATYFKHINAEVEAQARQNLAENGEQIKNDYISGKSQINTDLDADQAMQLLQGEHGELDKYEFNSILKNLAENGTQAGQFIQALAKYANTAEGAFVNATNVIRNEVEYWARRNKKAVGLNGKLAEALKLQGYDGTMDITKPKPTFEELRQSVKNTIDTEYSSISSQFSDADIDYLAHMIDHNASISDLVDALNTKMAKGDFGISEETMQDVNNLFEYAKNFDENSSEFVEAQAEAFRLLAEEVAPKASPMEKFDAWRYMAMLGNPKTMLRNFVGNKMFSAITGVSNNLAAIMEAGTDAAVKGGKKVSNKLFKTNFDTSKGIERTKSVLNPLADRSLIKAAKADAYDKRYRQIEGSKFEKMDKDALRKSRSVFNSGLMQLLEKAVDKGISDTKAVANKYSTSLAGYMKANGLTEADLDASYKYDELNRISKSRLLSESERAEMDSLRSQAMAMEKARDYALKQAEYATFHEDNKIADVITKFSRINQATKVVTEGLVPFKKTPLNILKSGVEYSPLGAIKSIGQTGKLIYENTGKRRGNLEDTYQRRNHITHENIDVNKTLASDVIQSWSQTLTGSGMAALGYYLFDKGILHSSTEDEKYQDDLEGKQNYSIEINGKTYTIDWAVPGSMSLLLGAEIKKAFDANAISDEKWYNNIDEMFGTLDGLFEPIIETSMLQGVQNTINTFSDKYDDAGKMEKLASAAATLGINYLGQAVPTLSGQIARTVDNTRRSTDTVNTGFLGNVEKQGRKIMNKIPELSKKNEAYVNARGEHEQNSDANSLLGRLAYQTLSPWYSKEIDTRKSDKIAREAYHGTNSEGDPIMEKEVFADWKSKVDLNGKKLNPEDMHDYRRAAYQANTEIREELARADWFKDLNDVEKTEILKSTNNLVDHIGKAEVDRHYETASKAYEAYKNGGVEGVLDYYKEDMHKAHVKETMGTTADYATEIYDRGNEKEIKHFKHAADIAKKYGHDTLSQKNWQIYAKKGEKELVKELKFDAAAKSVGLESATDGFKKAVTSGISPKAYAEEDKFIKSFKMGEDELGNPQYLEHNDTTSQIYRNDGKQGVYNYAVIKKGGGTKDTYNAFKLYNKKAKTSPIPALDAKNYMKQVDQIERYNKDGKTNGEVSMQELVDWMNAKGYDLSKSQAYWDAYFDNGYKIYIATKGKSKGRMAYKNPNKGKKK